MAALQINANPGGTTLKYDCTLVLVYCKLSRLIRRSMRRGGKLDTDFKETDESKERNLTTFPFPVAAS